MMTKQRIEQYLSLKREIAMLEDQICAAESAREFVTDTVRGSTKEIPYAMRNVVIKGYTSQHVPKLQKRKALLEAECAAVEGYIESVTDSTMRQLLVWETDFCPYGVSKEGALDQSGEKEFPSAISQQ